MKYTEIKPCPKCGSWIIMRGKPFTLRTPKIVRFIRRLHGVCCVNCGHYKPTIKAWNRRDDHA